MARNLEKRYRTGEFARHFGVSKDTLLYYDKIGLFRPAGVEENGYRYYTAAQGDAFWALHSLRQMDVPIQDLRGYFAAPSPGALSQLAHAQLAAVEEKAAQLARMRWLLGQMESATREAMGVRMNEVTLCALPAQRLLCSARNPAQQATSAAEWSRQYDVFLERLGLKGSAYIGSVVARADVEAGRFARVDRLFVQDEAGLFGGKPKRRPAGEYAVLYSRGSYEQVQAQYPFLLAEIARRGLRVCGDAYEEYLINELAAADEKDYVTKICVAVESTPHL